jgi:hypothetical protein
VGGIGRDQQDARAGRTGSQRGGGGGRRLSDAAFAAVKDEARLLNVRSQK